MFGLSPSTLSWGVMGHQQSIPEAVRTITFVHNCISIAIGGWDRVPREKPHEDTGRTCKPHTWSHHETRILIPECEARVLIAAPPWCLTSTLYISDFLRKFTIIFLI